MNAPNATEPAVAPRWPRIVLMIFAAINGLNALSDLTSVIANLTDGANRGLDGWMLSANAALHPLLAIASFVLAVRGDLRRAIVALAAASLANWALDLLPSIVRQGLELRGFGGFETLFQFAVLPLIAVMAIVLAARSERLGLATLLAVLPTVLGIAMVAAFTLTVMIYGF